eukprot:CAMPEP_0119011916 /NCGR_PEP_ID=MMETSP1176-20130426/5965_1 /TAXON_ID=265551 /ORGANISM="Synedropsis recta cf, Strain CCMP1620" /LENGTH=201 /DNA_ID=CAMNT_0006964795 /DNA_START=38 /DNA_END=644 /DNA_ORIENTATION=-
MMKDMAIAFLEERDLTAADLPTFILLHTALSALLVSSTWYWCYQHPSKFLSRAGVMNNKRIGSILKSPNTPGRVQRLLQNTMPSSSSTKLLATSFVEAKIGRLVAKPITIPTRLWLSWQGTVAWKQQQQIIRLRKSSSSGQQQQPKKKQRTSSSSMMQTPPRRQRRQGSTTSSSSTPMIAEADGVNGTERNEVEVAFDRRS